jgi:hypothetical protein
MKISYTDELEVSTSTIASLYGQEENNDCNGWYY